MKSKGFLGTVQAFLPTRETSSKPPPSIEAHYTVESVVRFLPRRPVTFIFVPFL